MTERIDSTPIFNDALNIIGTANELLKHLDEIEKDTPAKVQTYEAIKTVIETQSEAIRQLVEHHAELSDRLNQLIPYLE
jgi:uncharacterized protein YoxC